MTRSNIVRMGWVGLSLLGTLTLSSTVLACPGGGGGGSGGSGGGGGGGARRSPPTEALNACSGAAENQTCQFESPHGSIAGVCRQIQNEMACVPEGGPPQGQEGEIPQGA